MRKDEKGELSKMAPNCEPTTSRLGRLQRLTAAQRAREKLLEATDEALHRQCYYHGYIALCNAAKFLLLPGDFLIYSQRCPKETRTSVAPPNYKSLMDYEKARSQQPEIDNKSRNRMPCVFPGLDKTRHLLVVMSEERCIIEMPIYCTGTQGPLLFFLDPYVYGCPMIPELILHMLLWQWPTDWITNQRLVRPVKYRDWQIPHMHLRMENNLGYGSYGQVDLATWYTNGSSVTKKVAIKFSVEDKKALEGQRTALDEMIQEAEMLRTLRHENVVKVIGMACHQFPIFMVLEFISGGGLCNFLAQNKMEKQKALNRGEAPYKGITQYDRLSYCLQAARGIEYIHHMGSLHRDIASRNCLISTTDKRNGVNIVKVSDLGLARPTAYYQMLINRDGPIRWMSPETQDTKIWNRKSDIYSFAMLMWEIYTDAEKPYEGKNGGEVKMMVRKGIRPYKPVLAPNRVFNMMNIAWDKAPDNRPPMSNLVAIMEGYLAECSRDMPDPIDCIDFNLEKPEDSV